MPRLSFSVFLSILWLSPAIAIAQTASENINVEAKNLSTPELCADKDNVEIDFLSPLTRQFRIQAVHPTYIGSIGTDRWAPDLTSCDFHPDVSSFAQDAQRITIWESPMFYLVGYRLKDFWRPATVPVRVGSHSVEGLQIIQLWMGYRERAEEILVLYPPDGYWRARPLPFKDMRWTAYGSSFLVGPIEKQERPIVDLKEVAYEPETKTFVLSFKRGGTARLHLEAIDQDHISLDITLDQTIDGAPFAALRSMYATEENADATHIAWRAVNDKSWKESNIMTFPSASISEMWIGRRSLSRHNMSAPDMIFGRFSSQAH